MRKQVGVTESNQQNRRVGRSDFGHCFGQGLVRDGDDVGRGGEQEA